MWPARVAAAHTVLREADAEESYGLDLSHLGGLSVPTLLILGGDSPDYFREAVVRLHAALPNSRVHVMPGQRHIAMDTAPDEFVEAIMAFASESNVPPGVMPLFTFDSAYRLAKDHGSCRSRMRLRASPSKT